MAILPIRANQGHVTGPWFQPRKARPPIFSFRTNWMPTLPGCHHGFRGMDLMIRAWVSHALNHLLLIGRGIYMLLCDLLVINVPFITYVDQNMEIM